NGLLRLRYRWQGRQRSVATGLEATLENRAHLESLAVLVGKLADAGEDPTPILAKHLGRPELAVSTADPIPLGPTLADFYAQWIVQQTPPLVRKAQARDYRRHLTVYVLPALGQTTLAGLRPSDIRGLQADLLARKHARTGEPLSVKTVKNVI